MVLHVERDSYAAAVLVARMEDKALRPAPVWDDVTTFDGRRWRGRVDIICAGFPCQPVSLAGAQRGTEDDRWLWPHIARIIRDIRPEIVFLENVSGLLTSDGGFDAVLGDLAALGLDAEWTVLGAGEVGAAQRRDRVFVLAYADGHGRQQGTKTVLERTTIATQHGETMGYAPGGQRGIRCRTEEGPPGAAGGSSGDVVERPVANAEGSGRSRRSVEPGDPRSQLAALERGCRPLFAPGPDRYPADAPQPAVRRMDPRVAYRVDRLRCVGNGVVPLQAAVAFHLLADRAGVS